MSGIKTLNTVRSVLTTCALEGNGYAVATLKHINGQGTEEGRIKAAEGVKAEWDRLTALYEGGAPKVESNPKETTTQERRE